MSVQTTFTTLTNAGGVPAYVTASITPAGWPVGSSVALRYRLPSGVVAPVVPGVRFGPIENAQSVLLYVDVDTLNMVAASSPYLASISLQYFRSASGGTVIDSDTVDLICVISQRMPVISLTGTLDFSTTVGATLPQTKTMIVKNVGDALSTLNWGRVISTDAGISGKISTSMASGALAFNAQDSVVVSFDPTGVAAATYAGSITVNDTVISGVAPVVLPISVLVSPKYTGGVKIVADNGIGNRTMSYNAGGGGPNYDKWSYVWAPLAGKIFLYRYYDGHYTAHMSNSIGVNGPDVAVTATVNSSGYPSGGPVLVSQGGTTITFTFGPSVW